ncbi:MAG: methyltransferase domain-containing protein [Acidobacteriia bacterium]|nr:methyltransferase domain-containing protein [Terriglobia bacterium]
MAHRVCPWWLGYWLLSPLRKLRENPRKALGPHVREGMVVLEPGCGMGFFTLELARMVGPTGRVVAVDLQPRMLAGLARRASRAGLVGRIESRRAEPASLGIADLAGKVDVAVALHVVHELPDVAGFFGEVHTSLKPGGSLLIAEPRGHVSEADFGVSLEAAQRAGFRASGSLPGLWGRTALLIKA